MQLRDMGVNIKIIHYKRWKWDGEMKGGKDTEGCFCIKDWRTIWEYEVWQTF